jgi:hypothetical protein
MFRRAGMTFSGSTAPQAATYVAISVLMVGLTPRNWLIAFALARALWGYPPATWLSVRSGATCGVATRLQPRDARGSHHRPAALSQAELSPTRLARTGSAGALVAHSCCRAISAPGVPVCPSASPHRGKAVYAFGAACREQKPVRAVPGYPTLNAIPPTRPDATGGVKSDPRGHQRQARRNPDPGSAAT